MKNIEKKAKKFIKEEGIKQPITFKILRDYIKKSGFRLKTYKEGKGLLKNTDLEEEIKKVPAFTAKINDIYYVFYDENLNEQDKIFALSHECGHIYLNHLFTRRGAYDTVIHKEKEANVFAVYLVTHTMRKYRQRLSTLSGMLVGVFLCILSILIGFNLH